MKQALFLSMLIAGAMVSTQSQAMLPAMTRRLGVVAIPAAVALKTFAQKAECQDYHPLEQEMSRKMRDDIPFTFHKEDFNSEVSYMTDEKDDSKKIFVGKERMPYLESYKIGMQDENGNYAICGYNRFDIPVTYENYEPAIGWFGAPRWSRQIFVGFPEQKASYNKCVQLTTFLKNARRAAILNEEKQQ